MPRVVISPPSLQRPFLNWAGNKHRILPHLLPLLPADATHLIEPFVGSGAVFLNAHTISATLSDQNADLIALYEHLKTQPEAFIADCQTLFTDKTNTQSAYLSIRDSFNTSTSTWDRGVMFVYLNRHGFNGLCRYNRKGQFNVPFGRYNNPRLPEADMLAFADKAQNATFLHQDFRVTMANAQAGDVVYCDPPYWPLTTTANFTQYAQDGFGVADQVDLAQWAATLSEQGVHVILSNHDTPDTRGWYDSANLHELMVKRSISCKGDQRHAAPELIAVFTAQEVLRSAV